MVHLTGAGQLGLTLQEIIRQEPELNRFPMNLLGVFDRKDWGRGPCTVTNRWVHPSSARPCRMGLDQGDKYGC